MRKWTGQYKHDHKTCYRWEDLIWPHGLLEQMKLWLLSVYWSYNLTPGAASEHPVNCRVFPSTWNFYSGIPRVFSYAPSFGVRGGWEHRGGYTWGVHCPLKNTLVLTDMIHASATVNMQIHVK